MDAVVHDTLTFIEIITLRVLLDRDRDLFISPKDPFVARFWRIKIGAKSESNLSGGKQCLAFVAVGVTRIWEIRHISSIFHPRKASGFTLTGTFLRREMRF